jgi:DNA repair photolyase
LGMITAAHTINFRGRGSQINTLNRFLKQIYTQDHPEVIDEELLENTRTEFIEEFPRRIINAVNSPDIPFKFSMNPYQGCEHGCSYCYARVTHEYFNLSAGLDFERKIMVKKNAAQLLEKELLAPSWKPAPIMLSGNTDCYQPGERKFGITRKMLEVLLNFRNPVGIITKNSLILRDKDILAEMAKHNLVWVMVSITTLNEKLRRRMEPRTATGNERLEVIRELTAAGIPVGVMTAPIIPGLNSMEIPTLIKKAAEAGAKSAGYTMVRLNGSVEPIFSDWLLKNFPDSYKKVMNGIRDLHGGKVGDNRFGTRMKGEGHVAQAIRNLFVTSLKKYLPGKPDFSYNVSEFRRAPGNQLNLF